jgi:hypothetical protein
MEARWQYCIVDGQYYIFTYPKYYGSISFKQTTKSLCSRKDINELFKTVL